jgi:hypothetical protein
MPLDKGLLQIVYCLMAKQSGEVFIEATIDDLTFYKMDGLYYVRMKSSLSSKQFWKGKAFERSRESCKRFSEGNKLASRLYRIVEEEKRNYKLFCFLKKRAIQLLKEGKSLAKAEEILIDYLIEFKLFGEHKSTQPTEEERKNAKQNFLVKLIPAKALIKDSALSIFVAVFPYRFCRFPVPRSYLRQSFSDNHCGPVNDSCVCF